MEEQNNKAAGQPDNSQNESEQQLKNEIITESAPKKKKNTLIIALFFIVVVVAALGGIIYFSKFKQLFIAEKTTKIEERKEGDLSGFSKLIIDSANLKDNFTFKPEKSDSIGVEPESVFNLKSKEPIDSELIKESLRIKPKIAYVLNQTSETEWQLMPKEPLPPNTLFQVAMRASFIDETGQQKEHDYSWVYQIKDSFKVIHNIPRETATYVPLDTGIEITFSHDNFTEFEKYFEIKPNVNGSFEKHGRTMVFVPKEPLGQGSLYQVIVKKGLPISGSEEKLGEDHVFTFETRSSARPARWLGIYERMIEISPKYAPVLQISSYQAPNELEAELYKFPDGESYLASLKERDQLPWWSYSKEDFLLDTSKLQKINSFKLEVRTSDRTKYVEFPNSLATGLYLAVLKSGEQKVQVWIQSSDIAAYYNVTKSDTIFWVNDIVDKGPANNALIELVGTNYRYRTDENGLSSFPTPAEILKTPDKKQNTTFYFKVSEGSNVLVLPANRIFRTQWWGSSSEADDYWLYLYTDRPRYQPTDTVKYWGVLKKRDGKPITDKVTITLFKEGYVDYYYRPVSIRSEEAALSDFGTFEGEMKIDNVRPDYYALELKIGDRVIKRRYITIRQYTKPAFELSLTPDKRYAFADEQINLQVKASFFEGTPVPNLSLIFKTPKGEEKFTTDENGEAVLSYSAGYYDCHKEYKCWPEYKRLSIRPEDSEMAEITAETNITYYGPKVYLTTKTNYPEKGVGEIIMDSKFIDLDKLTSDIPWWQRNQGEEIAPGTRIEGEVIKITHHKNETGTRYDFINKRSYKTYSYSKEEKKLRDFSEVTGNDGKFIFRQTVEPDTSYKIKFRVYDSQGRYDNYSRYLYYFDGSYYNRYSGHNYHYYKLKFPEETDNYSIGDEVRVEFMDNDAPMPDDTGKYLYLQLQNGLQEYDITDRHQYNFTFKQEDIPNINLAGVYFNGFSYITAGTGYSGSSVNYRIQDKALKIDIITDKDKYLPGGKVNLSITVKDQRDVAVQAEVNLNLIDEAFYAIAGDVAKPLEKLYAKVGPGTLLTKKTHDSLMASEAAGAEKGGCFAAGTKILMADGSSKLIENIERGDTIATFINPLTRKLASGKVMEIWRDTAVEFIVINDKIRVTPEHQIFASNRFIDAGLLKVGDWLLSPTGERIPIRSISIDHEVRPIYNLRIEPQNTFFADGIYVHNQEKGGGPREYFTDAALFKNVRTNSSGQVNLEFTLPDNITSWRVTAQAITLDLRAGTNVANIPVSLPVFADVSIGKEYLLDDKPIAKLRAFGNALNKEDKVEFSVKAPDLGLEQSDMMLASAFEPAYFNLPAFKIGNYQIIYNLKTAKGNDAIKLPLAVISSRLEKQTVENQPLTLNTKIRAKNNLPIAIILSNQERSRLYNILQRLGWSWGDRIDQKYTRVLARKMLEEDFEQKILAPNFNPFDYQTQSGGITLLPYSSEDLELSARVSALNTKDFDQESLAQYFYKILNNKKSNQEEISLALFGLAELGKPVLARINSWLGRDDLSVKEKLYLALGLADLGAKEWARSIYYDILEQYGRSKEPHYIIKINDNLDDTFETTMIASALAASLGAEEAYGLLDYVQKNQRIYGLRKNSERLYNFEKLQYVSRTIPRTQGGSLKIVYEFDGKKNEVELDNNETHSFEINSSDIDKLKFLGIEGDAYVSVRYIEPLNLTEVQKDNDISIKREYYVAGHKVNEFSEKDTIEVRLYPSFKSSALSGYYQVTDILPSGLQPVSKISTRLDDRGCRYWYPYNTDGQKVKYKIHRDWKFSRCGGYIKYYARVVNTGKYKAEPAVLQSFDNPEYINFSKADEVIITK